MKTLTANALAQVLQLEGTEPLIIVGIEWNGTNVTYYCDKEVPGTQGKILSIGPIEAIVAGDNKTSQSVDLMLDDTDGTIKTIIDTTNIYKVNCTVYQFYGALNDLADKFVVLKGQIQTPFTWDEKERSISFTVLSEIESYEVGFSPEEGQLDFVTDENIGKPWPLCFGSPVHVPAARVGKSIEGYAEGELDEDFGIVDEMLYIKRQNIVDAYNQEKYLLFFWIMAARGTSAISRKCADILRDYMRCLQQERVLFVNINLLLQKISDMNHAIREGDDFESSLDPLKEQLDFLSVVANTNAFQKEQLEKEAELANFRYELTKKAYNNAIDAYNNMRGLYADYVNINNEICRQSKVYKDTIRIKGGDKFPQGVETEILIANVRFRGTFNGELFTIVAGPLATFHDLPVAPWVKDDDPCAPEDESNGLATFYLANTPPENLTGMYLLVKARGETGNLRHIIHVERQEGQKVVFGLINWPNDTSGGVQGAMSIEEQLNQMEEVPLLNTPFGILPSDLFEGSWRFDAVFGIVNTDFNGSWYGSPWNTPEGKQIIQLINAIPFGVTKQEFEIIGRLVYGSFYDNLGEQLLFFEPTPRELFTIIGEDIGEVVEASPIVLKSWWERWAVNIIEIPDQIGWTVDAGTSISMSEKDCDVYIANILPSTIKAVFAFRTVQKTNRRIFAQIPSSYYIKNESANLGTIDVTALTFPRSLKNIPGEGWEDDVFVTLESSVGPNVVDVIQWLIETYTNGTVNTSNFAAIKAKLQDGEGAELYPVNFALQDRPNVLDEIGRIAWEARCGIYRVGNEFFLKYLSEEPTSDMTFTEDDIDDDTHIAVTFTDAESLVTRMVCTYFPDYKPLDDNEKPYREVLRHNVKLYGLHSEDQTFHIYNNKELVIKSATFWLIRKANAWKRIKFKTFLSKLQLDPFDCINFNFSHRFICNVAVKGLLLTANYDPTDNSITMEAELPIKAGEMTKYDLYWPAQVPEETLFPTVIEIEKGYAGGYGPGSGVTGTINDC